MTDQTKPTEALGPGFVDPSYTEPTPTAKFIEVRDLLARTAGEVTTPEDVRAVSAKRAMLINFLIKRIADLESALVPFVVSGTMMANAMMTLHALGRADEPAGGTWLSNPPDNVILQPTASSFFRAIDVFGRTATEEHMVAVFTKIQEAAALQAEKDTHTDTGQPVH